MKKLLLFVVLLCSQMLFAQNDWIGNVHFDNAVDKIFVKSNGEILLQMKTKSDGIIVLDSMGTLVKKLQLNNGYAGKIGGILEQGDSTLVLISGSSCDALFISYYVFDENWEMISEVYPQAPIYGAGSFYRLEDGSWVIYDNDRIERYDPDFNALIGHRNTNSYEEAFVIVPGDTMILVDGLQLIKMTSDFEVVKSTIISQVFDLELASDGTILAFGLDWIAKYDTELNMLDIKGYPHGYYKQAAVTDGEFAVLTDVPSVVRFTNDLQMIGEFELENIESVTFNDLSYHTGKLVLGGGKRWGTIQHGNQSGFLKFYTLDGQTDPIYGDVQLNGVEHLGSMHSVWVGPNHWNVTFYDIKIDIENKSSDTLHTVVLNSRMDVISIPIGCIIFREYSWLINDLDIPPYQSGEAFLDSIEYKVLNTETPDFAPCFWLSLPNDSWDTDNDNDVFCANLPVAVKPERVLKEFSVFPNPAGGQLQVARESWMPTNQASYVLTDVLGRAIAAWNVEPASDRQSLNLENVPAGVYTLLVKSRGQVLGAARVVKQ
ncbi:MAG: hypothetical protein CMN32_03430 [Saprospirales bacterium]|nr:hypothetical protein [Saprospirales bacterium]